MNIILLTLQSRTGSFFLQSLLDHHPEIIFFCAYYCELDFFLNLNNKNDEIVDEFIHKNPNAFHNGYAKPPHFSKDRANFKLTQISKSEFKNNFLSLCDNLCDKKISSKKELFELLHLAYAKTIGYSDISKIKYILVHIHSFPISKKDEKYSEFFFTNYPNLKLLVSTRDFMEASYSMLSYMKKMTRGGKFSVYKFGIFQTLISFNINSKYVYDIYMKIGAENTLFVYLESLHSLQDEAMKKIADFLDIKFDKNLIQSTFLGKIWQGNTIDKSTFNGFDADKSRQKRSQNLSYKDLLLIKLCNYSTAKAFGYEIEPLKGFEKIYARIYFSYLFIRPILRPFYWFEDLEMKNLDPSKIQNKFYKKLPFWLSKRLIFMRKKINRTKEFYRDLHSFYIWRKTFEMERFFADKRIDQDRFL